MRSSSFVLRLELGEEAAHRRGVEEDVRARRLERLADRQPPAAVDVRDELARREQPDVGAGGCRIIGRPQHERCARAALAVEVRRDERLRQVGAPLELCRAGLGPTRERRNPCRRCARTVAADSQSHLGRHPWRRGCSTVLCSAAMVFDQGRVATARPPCRARRSLDARRASHRDLVDTSASVRSSDSAVAHGPHCPVHATEHGESAVYPPVHAGAHVTATRRPSERRSQA